jgi:type VI secretion system secreted protein VgrG
MPDTKSINAAFSANSPGCVVQPCPKKSIATGLGKDVDAVAALSPTLQKNVQKLREDGWKIKYGEPGKGSFCRRDRKEIIIDPDSKGKPVLVTQTLAHESGHALYQPDPYIPPAGLTRQVYIDSNAARDLADEGEATLMNCQIRAEIISRNGPNIGVAGAQEAQYEKIYAKYSKPEDRDQARREIATIFANGEHLSTAPSMTYGQYYEKPYADYFDKLPPHH